MRGADGRHDRIDDGLDELVVQGKMSLQEPVVGRTVEQVEQQIGVS